MRNKKRILFLLTVIFCLTGLYSCNKNFLLLWDANNMYVSTRNNIDKDKVKIEFGISVNTINRETDAELFADRDKYAVLFDGSLKNKMISEYGENDFLITYDNRCYLSFRQFKTNRRQRHQIPPLPDYIAQPAAILLALFSARLIIAESMGYRIFPDGNP